MIYHSGLLDTPAMNAGCICLSDLHCLDARQRGGLVQALKDISDNSANLKAWNDALQYLSKDVPQGTAEATSKRLIQALFRSMAAGPMQENFAPRQK